jgi:hypothetical protein
VLIGGFVRNGFQVSSVEITEFGGIFSWPFVYIDFTFLSDGLTKFSSVPVSTGNMFQDLPPLSEPRIIPNAIYNVIFV